ncbi:hypothetical protein AAVH_15011 [Aphelenchoides avenae]|nr:hypothetical protein AAVH_15011 [Aphelenchus avenae]
MFGSVLLLPSTWAVVILLSSALSEPSDVENADVDEVVFSEDAAFRTRDDKYEFDSTVEAGKTLSRQKRLYEPWTPRRIPGGGTGPTIPRGPGPTVPRDHFLYRMVDVEAARDIAYGIVFGREKRSFSAYFDDPHKPGPLINRPRAPRHIGRNEHVNSEQTAFSEEFSDPLNDFAPRFVGLNDRPREKRQIVGPREVSRKEFIATVVRALIQDYRRRHQ